MKLKDLLSNHYDPKEVNEPKSIQDILAIMRQVIRNSNIERLDLKLISTEKDLEKGKLVFQDKKNKLSIDIEGRIYFNRTKCDEVHKRADLYSQYSLALNKLIKRFKEKDYPYETE